MDITYRVFRVPESVREAIPDCSFTHYSAQNEIPAAKLIPFYENVLMPVHRKVMADLRKSIRQNRLN